MDNHKKSFSFLSGVVQLMRRAGKSRGFTAAALLFGVCFFLTLGMVIMPAATSEQERQSAQVHPTIEAEITRAFTGESMDVTVHAKVPEHEPFRVFTLLAESDRAGLSGLLTFDARGIAVIQDEAGNPIELHRTLREGEENELDYWFVLYGGQETVFTLSVEDQLDIGELRRETEAAERNRERQATAEAVETTAPGETQPARPASPANASGPVTTSTPAAASATSIHDSSVPIASPSNARRAEKPAASKTIERPAAPAPEQLPQVLHLLEPQPQGPRLAEPLPPGAPPEPAPPEPPPPPPTRRRRARIRRARTRPASTMTRTAT